MKTPFYFVRRGAPLALCLAVFVFLRLGAAMAADTAVSGSKHDFSGGGTVAKGGTCGACHVSHAAESDYVLWSRGLKGLGQEDDIFDQTSNPNYARGFTIACFDCHDNHSTVDNDPPDNTFPNTSRPPQDVAFDDDMETTNPRDGLNNDDKPGYYENIPSGTVRGTSTYESGHYVKNNPGAGSIAQGDKLPCSDCHDPHRTKYQAFIREDLPGTPQVPAGTRASTRMAYTDPSDDRNDAESRKFCIACHGTSEQTTYKAVTFSAVKPSYGSATIAKPTTRISAHLSTKTTACTQCHRHNGISVSCEDCHGFPPLRTIAQASGNSFDRVLRPDVENYTGGAGAHQRHKDALGDAIFQCEICHGPDAGSAAWHNQGAGTFPGTNPGQNVDVMGDGAYWDPTNTRSGASAPRYTGAASSETLPAGYEFKAKGGGDQRCANFACHGDPPDNAGDLTWTADMVDGDTPYDNPAAADIRICKWCHDATPSEIDPDLTVAGTVYAPNAMGNGLSTAVGFGAEVNGHGVGLPGAVKAVYDRGAVGTPGTAGAPDNAAGAAKDCIVCHNTRYVAGVAERMHFPSIHSAPTDPRDAKRLESTINGGGIGTSTTYPTGPDQACNACHQNGVDTVADGLDQSHHSNTAGGYVPLEGSFTRACRQCHNVHGANFNGAGRNLYMIGKWIDVDSDGNPDATERAYVDSSPTPGNLTLAAITTADDAVVFTATTGPDSFDENDGVYDQTGAADNDDICAACHVPATGGGAGTGGGNHSGSTAGIGELRGQDCMTCHDHDYDNITTTSDAFMPSGCSGCHGVPPPTNQYWPDGAGGTPLYADDNAGAHQNHVEAISRRVFGQTAAQLLLDANSSTKQRQICRYCHPNPGGGGHSTNSGDSRVDLYTASGPGNYFGRFSVGAEPLPPVAPVEDTTGAAYVPGAVNQGTCGNLVCHNQTTTPFWNTPPVWVESTLPNTTCSNLACHAVTTYTIAHDTHVDGAPIRFACTECHADNYTVSGTNPIPLAHGNGEVDMKWDNAGSLEAAHGSNGYYDKNNNTTADPAPTDTGFTYKTGGAAAADATYARSCYRVYCHGGDNNATYTPDWGGSGNTPNVKSPVWNLAATPLACTTCHAAPPPDGRHLAHDANGVLVPLKCGSCHTANNNKTDMTGHTATHVNGSVDMGGNATVYAYNPADGSCSNSCHLVTVATDGDWVDADPLACTDCHSATHIGPAPASGLHAATTALRHDFCPSCHLATAPSTTHLDGTTQNSTVPGTTYNWNTTDLNRPISYDNTGYVLVPPRTFCQATCHTDYPVVDSVPVTPSPWKRRWVGAMDAKPVATDNPGADVCDNCHGDGTGTLATWNLVEADATTTDHTDPYGGNTGDKMDRHSVCQTCHGWGHANYDRGWNGTAPAHGDGSITMNGPEPTTGAGYINVGTNAGGCAKACHAATLVLNTNSGWPVNYGDFGAGDCENCHDFDGPGPNVMGPGTNFNGVGTTPKPYDDGAWGYNVNGHGSNGSAPNAPTTALTPDKACTDCHSLLSHHLNGVIDGVTGRGNAVRHVNNYHLLTDGTYPFIVAGSNAWDVQVGFDLACYMRCHQPAGVSNMRHAKAEGVAANNLNNVLNAVRFGDKATVADGESIAYPVDSDISTLGSTAPDDFTPCISCHNPHGTAVTESGKNTNRMMRDKFQEQSTLCLVCHI